MKKSIILNDITCLDAAEVWIDPETPNFVVVDGISKMVGVEVFGNVDENEQVIVDFSNLKKVLKDLIDDPSLGYDHKLLMNLGDYSKDCVHFGCDIKKSMKKGKPRDCLRIYDGERMVFEVKGQDFLRVYDGLLQDSIGEYLTHNASAVYGRPIDVKVTLSGKATKEMDGKFRAYFNYMHGLRNSSSFGCQNIIHGHRSFVQVFLKNGDVDEKLSKDIARYMDGCYIFNDKTLKTHFVINDEYEYYRIKYNSKSRGKWTMVLPTNYFLPLDSEPTIENIVDHIAYVYRDDLKLVNAHSIVISEGLTKAGCVVL